MNNLSRITRREWRNVLLYALLIIVLTTIPYLLAWMQQGDTHQFRGFLFAADDGYSYLGKMRLGARGLLDFYLFYTPEPHAAAPLIFLPYILPGWIVGRFINDHNPALVSALSLAFHVMSKLFDVLLIGVLYRFIAVFIKQPHTRFLALVLATLGGGLGWLLLMASGSNPPEFFIPEGFSFLILFGLPHLALARAAFLGGFLFLFKALESHRISQPQNFPHPSLAGWRRTEQAQGSSRGRGGGSLGIRYSVLSALCWLVVGLAVPFYLAIIYAILGIWGLATWAVQRRFPRELLITAGIAAGLTLPLFAYFTYIFSANPAFAAWSAQNLLPSPPPLHYALAYSLLIAFALIAGRWAWNKANLTRTTRNTPYILLLAWPLVVPILVYIPLNVQRRMAEAVIVPLAILAAVGLRFLKRQPRWKRLGRPAVILMCLSSLVFLFGVTATTLFNIEPPLYRPITEVAALNWLNSNLPADSVVLASFETGNVLPAFTNLRPYVGHGPETLKAIEKTATVEHFFADQMNADERRSLYASVKIRYIFYGPLEQTLLTGTSAVPAWQTDADKIYDADGYQIWQVK